ncbi:hypothetical protein DKG34_40725 [Streptomyces sp. NWU49]|uniref:DNA/RNA non-specific endonuclease n=1 Tax=Streptomyces sp. NWU49 TaxID=2201153 RepID=UPI000D684E01|nr:DNA/RNA non-specific endonuclease [Streptomyces sp. NWU49]PWJ02075.1 hypothetical protein DKG34_40725 [Streptomyces sp. NWU49]
MSQHIEADAVCGASGPCALHGRSQGAIAVLCPSDLKPTGSKKDDLSGVPVVGMPSPSANSVRPGVSYFHKTHIIGDKFSGDPVAENLFAGHSRMNLSGMKRCERKMIKQLEAGNSVLYSGQLSYADPSDQRPDAIQMKAFTKAGPLFNARVQNNDQWQQTC